MSEDYSRVFHRRLEPWKRNVRSVRSLGMESSEAIACIPKGSLRGKSLVVFNDWVSKLGEQYIERQTADVNNTGPDW